MATPPPHLANMETSATIKVLHTTELLEQILVNVTDMKTLLLAQRVDKFWSEVIGNSSKLQKKLFFKPATHKELFSLCMMDIYNAPDINLDWTEDNYSPGFVTSSGRSTWNSPSTSFSQVNPLICYKIYFGEGDRKTISIPPQAMSSALGGSITPSFNRMLATQPPTASFHVSIPSNDRSGILYGLFAPDSIIPLPETFDDTLGQILVAFETVQQQKPYVERQLKLSVSGRSAKEWHFMRALAREKEAWPEEVQYVDSDYDD